MIIYNDHATIITDGLNGQYDDYGRPLLKEIETKAHVRYKADNIYNRDGELVTSKALVYVPYSDELAGIDFNPRIEITTPTGSIFTSKVIRTEYGQTIAGYTQFIKFYLG